MVKITDYFPKTPRPGPEPVWLRSLVCIVFGAAGCVAVAMLKPESPSPDSNLIDTVLGYVYVLPGFVAFGSLLFGLIYLRESHHRSIWRNGRIEPVLIEDFRYVRTNSGASGAAIVALSSHSPTGLMSASAAAMTAFRLRGRRLKKVRLRVANHHFNPDNLPEAAWIITPRAGWMPCLHAEVAPAEWSKFGTPDEVAEDLRREIAVARARKANRDVETVDETRQNLQRKYD